MVCSIELIEWIELTLQNYVAFSGAVISDVGSAGEFFPVAGTAVVQCDLFI